MAPHAKGVSGPVRRFGASLLSLGRIRLELLAIEVHEEKGRVADLLFWSVLSALMVGFGALFVALFVTVALWESQRLLALGVGMAVFAAMGVFGVWRVRRFSAGGPTLFRMSIDELREDGAALQPGPPP
ncbi:MAG: phage holin family protein [Burkholderiales bacterium]|nr:phage holin family protein [Burkholderiales bacterium]